MHVEVAEVPESAPETPINALAPPIPISPLSMRHRANSLLYRYTVTMDEASAAQPDSVGTPSSASPHKGSISKEVRLPAFQFLNLIRPSFILLSSEPFSIKSAFTRSSMLINRTAWMSEHPTGEEEISQYLKDTRPTLGICLKRYAMVNNSPVRVNTEVDIPIDIRLPHFIEDDERADLESPLMRNFTLSLQSVICHRGSDLNSGHYVCFIRAQPADGDSRSSRRLSTSNMPPEYSERWFKHDDLANPRVSVVPDIVHALKEEMPYLLFYQVQPIYEPSQTLVAEPPAYSEMKPYKHVNQYVLPAPSRTQTTDGSISQCMTDDSIRSSPMLGDSSDHAYFDGVEEYSTSTQRRSAEIERPRRSINLPEDWRSITFAEDGHDKSKESQPPEVRRGSVVAFSDSVIGSAASSIRVPDITSTPATPVSEETTSQRLSRAASKFRNGSRSRPTSSSGENRLSLSISRFTQRSKEQLVRRDAEQVSTSHTSPDFYTGTTVTPDGANDSTTSGATTPANEGVLSNGGGETSKLHTKTKKSVKGKEPVLSLQGNSHSHHQRHKSKDGKDPRECEVM